MQQHGLAIFAIRWVTRRKRAQRWGLRQRRRWPKGSNSCWPMASLRQCMVVALLAVVACSTPKPLPPDFRWAVYYDDDLPAQTFVDLDLVVFDRTHHPKLKPLKNITLMFAYISVGELPNEAPEREAFEKERLLVAENKRWGSQIVDIANPRWKAHVMKQVEDAIAKGFDGVMLDTVDSPLHWAETLAPEQTGFMRRGAIDLVKAIREAHPKLKIMVNRGFEILPAVADQIDFILAESILANPNDSTGQFTLFPPNTYTQAAEQLRDVVALAPRLRIVTLDYWDLDDTTGMERIYAMQRANGFTPYVTSRDLRHFTPEPQ